MNLRHALRKDIALVAEIWVDAFAHDPFFRWIQPDDAAWPAFGRDWMTFIAEMCFERGHTFVADDESVAVAWVPPDLALIGADDIMRGRAILDVHAGEARGAQALETIMAVRGLIPDDSHWTLQYIGVRSARQGTGLGEGAVAPGLGTCDVEALPCRLVSSNPRNLSFYERAGFAVQAEVPSPDGAITLRPMHRPPRPQS